jgi:antitoxin component YwqK of YwqJK toxin-antitoxin module
MKLYLLKFLKSYCILPAKLSFWVLSGAIVLLITKVQAKEAQRSELTKVILFDGSSLNGSVEIREGMSEAARYKATHKIELQVKYRRFTHSGDGFRLFDHFLAWTSMADSYATVLMAPVAVADAVSEFPRVGTWSGYFDVSIDPSSGREMVYFIGQGERIVMDENRNVIMRGEWYNGMPIGLHQTFLPDGRLKSELMVGSGSRDYVDGALGIERYLRPTEEGELKYYSSRYFGDGVPLNGKVSMSGGDAVYGGLHDAERSLVDFVNGWPHGEILLFKNGIPLLIELAEYGKCLNIIRRWYDNGQLEYEVQPSGRSMHWDVKGVGSMEYLIQQGCFDAGLFFHDHTTLPHRGKLVESMRIALSRADDDYCSFELSMHESGIPESIHFSRHMGEADGFAFYLLLGEAGNVLVQEQVRAGKPYGKFISVCRTGEEPASGEYRDGLPWVGSFFFVRQGAAFLEVYEMGKMLSSQKLW